MTKFSEYIMKEENVKFQNDEIQTKFDKFINDSRRNGKLRVGDKEYIYKLSNLLDQVFIYLELNKVKVIDESELEQIFDFVFLCQRIVDDTQDSVISLQTIQLELLENYDLTFNELVNILRKIDNDVLGYKYWMNVFEYWIYKKGEDFYELQEEVNYDIRKFIEEFYKRFGHKDYFYVLYNLDVMKQLSDKQIRKIFELYCDYMKNNEYSEQKYSEDVPLFKYLDDINVLDDEDFYTMIQFVSNYGNIGSWNFHD